MFKKKNQFDLFSIFSQNLQTPQKLIILVFTSNIRKKLQQLVLVNNPFNEQIRSIDNQLRFVISITSKT